MLRLNGLFSGVGKSLKLFKVPPVQNRFTDSHWLRRTVSGRWPDEADLRMGDGASEGSLGLSRLAYC